jgi:cytochrome c biogenesis protein CcmG/thiol:disulfide interchange protein DsbE
MTDTTFPVEESVEQPQRRGGFGLGQLLVLGAIVVIGVIVGLTLNQQNQTQPTGGPAPDFTLTTFDGQSVRLSELKGNVVVLNFWASWCAPCRAEAPHLQTAWEKYKDQDVVFLGVAYADNGPRSMAFMEEYGFTYLNGPDLETRISEMYNIQGVPETFIIDKEGNIDKFLITQVNVAQLSGYIDPLLAEG